MNSQRVRGYLRAAESAASEGRADQAASALRLAREAAAAMPPGRRAQATQVVDEVASRVEDRLAGRPASPLPTSALPTSPPPLKVTAPPAKPATVEELLGELDELVGLAEVKAEVKRLIALAQVAHARKGAGMPAGERTRHLAMVGAPGTGKTTVARLLGQIYGALGVVGDGHLVEVTRADLVAGFVGQTATRTNAVCDQALGGVLFIDEAYSLVSGGEQDFGHEALAELVKRMEDDRGRLVVILAGYPAEMDRMIAANSGLRSRLQETLTFADYSPGELVEILRVIAQRDHWRLSDDARARARSTLEAMYAKRGADWANARTVRTFFEECLARQALRVTADGTITGVELDLVEAADIPVNEM